MADDSLALTTSENRFKIMSNIYNIYAQHYSIIYEFSKLELNIWGVKTPEEVGNGLEFGGHKHKISPESTNHNLNRRLAKTNAKVWLLMSKCWAKNKHIQVTEHSYKKKCITKPMLLSGLQALTITDPSLKPLEQFQDQMIRQIAKEKGVVLFL